MSRFTYGECSVGYCTKDAINKSKVLCGNHLARLRAGREDWNQKSMYEKTEVERFWEKVDKSGPISDYAPHLGECWIWTGSKTTTPGGSQYGGFRCLELGGSTTSAHRVSYFYEIGVGSTMEDHLDHLCRVTLCVRPSHLELVPMAENVKRGIGPTALNAAKTHCVHGHELAGENLYVWSGDGGRKCRECHKKHSLAWARKNAKTTKGAK